MAGHPAAIVVFVHGCGTDRHDSLNLAAGLVRAGFATLLVDLLENGEAHDCHDTSPASARSSSIASTTPIRPQRSPMRCAVNRQLTTLEAAEHPG